MLVVKFKNNPVHKQMCNCEGYNIELHKMIFVHVKDEWYTPFWYYSLVRKQGCKFDKCLGCICKLFANYYKGQIKKHIAEVRFIDNYPNKEIKYGEYIRFIASLRVLGFSIQEVLKIIGDTPKNRIILRIIEQSLDNYSNGQWFNTFKSVLISYMDNFRHYYLPEDFFGKYKVFNGVTQILTSNYKMLRVRNIIIPVGVSMNNHVMKIITRGKSPFKYGGTGNGGIFRNAIFIEFDGVRFTLYLTYYSPAITVKGVREKILEVNI